MKLFHPSFRPRGSSVGVLLWSAAAVGVAVKTLSSHYPIGEWLVWRYLAFAAWTVVWLISCAAAGYRVVRRFSHGDWPFMEELVQGLAIGVLLWGLVVFVFGICHGLYPFLFFALPLAFSGVGLPALGPRLARFWTHWKSGTRLAPRPPPFTHVIAAAGAIGIALLYAMILSPKFLAYDARWYHVALSEQWAGIHAIVRSTDGSNLASRPHLANWLYTWAFLWPGSSLFARAELALHMEFGLFLGTLASIPVALRALLPTRRFWPAAAASLLLFPGIFVYDSAISGGADHVLAFYALPVFLAWRRASRSLSRENAIHLGVQTAAATLVKYQAIYFIAGVGLALIAKSIAALVRHEGPTFRRAVVSIGWTVGAAFLVTSPLWLTNLVWYGNPVFPFLVRLFPSHPWGPDVIELPDYHDPRWVGAGSLASRLASSLSATFTFGFEANDWPLFHGEWPVYGFLFSLLAPLALLLRNARRAAPLALMSLLGIFVWHFTYRQARYLQALTPWLAVVVACVIATSWREGVLARMGMIAVVGLQVVWGSDHPFLPSHAMLGSTTPFSYLLSLASSGYTRRHDVRNVIDTDLAELSAALPEKSKVLLHERHLILGLERDSIVDAAGIQSAISYRTMQSPREVWELLRKLGVTHVFWSTSSLGWDNGSSDGVFFDFVTHFLPASRNVNGGKVAPLPDTPPRNEGRYRFFRLIGCDRDTTMSAVELDKALSGKPATSAAPGTVAKVWFMDTNCGDRPSTEGLDLAGTRGPWQIWSARP